VRRYDRGEQYEKRTNMISSSLRNVLIPISLAIDLCFCFVLSITVLIITLCLSPTDVAMLCGNFDSDRVDFLITVLKNKLLHVCLAEMNPQNL
jgi:hypothetical protein